MKYKELIKTQLKDLKSMGKSRREIEEDLGYSEKYIDQALARGGNEALLNALGNYKTKLEHEESTKNVLNDPLQVYSNKDDFIKTLQYTLRIQQENIILLKQEIRELKEKYEGKGKAGGRRRSA